MKQVTVKTADLLGKVMANRDGHRAEFEKALVGYKIRAEEELERHLNDVRNGVRAQVFIHLPLPEDHTTDYDMVIGMLAMEVNETVTIGDDDFRAYVMDDWSWKRAWNTSNASYFAAAADK